MFQNAVYNTKDYIVLHFRKLPKSRPFDQNVLYIYYVITVRGGGAIFLSKYDNLRQILGGFFPQNIMIGWGGGGGG